jgi:hypothetical protein
MRRLVRDSVDIPGGLVSPCSESTKTVGVARARNATEASLPAPRLLADHRPIQLNAELPIPFDAGRMVDFLCEAARLVIN